MKFFGIFQDWAHAKEKEFEFSKTLSAQEVYTELSQLFPKSNSKLPVLFAVNLEFATGSTMLKNGDTLAFIPPMSGG